MRHKSPSAWVFGRAVFPQAAFLVRARHWPRAAGNRPAWRAGLRHGLLLSILDRLVDIYRLIYDDQRGRDKSADRVQPDDVSLATDLEDIERPGSISDWRRRRC